MHTIKYIINLRLIMLVIVCHLVNITFATSYYVSTDGDDSGNGSASDPLKQYLNPCISVY
jgi:hypothetical protein